jgi:hypothetical protein
LSWTVSSLIRAVLFSSAVLASAGWVHANPAKVHNEVVRQLNQPVEGDAASPEIKRAEQEARATLKRATDAQKSSDPAQRACAPVLADTALEWAQFRNELGALSALQAQVKAAQKRLSEATAALKREQAYLEETEARRGRALAALDQLKAAPQVQPPAPSAVSPKGTKATPTSKEQE